MGPDPLPIPVLFVKNGKLQAFGFGSNHNNLTGELFNGGFPTFFGFLPNSKREGHCGFQLTFLAHGAFEMYARAFIRKHELDRHCVKGPVASVGGVPTVGVNLGGLT
jgi:hypothetical protein